MIFRFDKNEKILLDADVLKLCPNLKKLSQDKLLFIVMAFDYKSPIHRFPEEERIRKAKLFAFGDSNIESEKDAFLNKCIQDYKDLQFDVRRETLRQYEAKIIQLNNDLFLEQSPKRVTDIDAAIERLTMRMKKMQNEIDMDDEAQRIIQGGSKISLIEKYQENLRTANKHREQKKEAARFEML